MWCERSFLLQLKSGSFSFSRNRDKYGDEVSSDFIMTIIIVIGCWFHYSVLSWSDLFQWALGTHKTTTRASLWVPRWWMGWCNQTTLSNSYCKKTVLYKEEDLELIKWRGDWRHDNWHPNSNSTNNKSYPNTAPENHQFWWYLNWVSSCLSFFLSASNAATIIFGGI